MLWESQALIAHETPSGSLPDWRYDFQSFTLFHLLTVAFFAGAMLVACYFGRCWRETARERRFRLGWGWAILLYQTWYTAWYFMPAHFTWESSLPLHLCDLAAWVAGLAMVTQWRPWRTLLYFWGIGLSTQAFFTPTLQYGYQTIQFWMFWIGHTMIVGSAVYDIVVLRYRPSLRDFGQALLVSFMYCFSIFFVNVWMSAELGRPINYAYIGDTRPTNRTLIDDLGPWPRRVLKMMAIVLVDYALLYSVWPISRAIRRRLRPAP